MSGLKNNVPATMRKPLENAAVILPVVISQHYGGDLNEAIEFIAGALNHQERVTALKEDGKTDAPSFPVIVEDVKIIERRAGSSLLGKKAIIHFTDAKDRSKAEQIETGFTEYHGSDAGEYAAWQTSLANTLVDVANANIGKECIMTKAYVKGVKTKYNDSGKVKFLANLEPKNGHASETRSSGSRGTQTSEKPSVKEVSVKDFESALDSVNDVEGKLVDSAFKERELIRDLVSALNSRSSEDDVLDLLLKDRGEEVLTEDIERDYLQKSKNGDIVDAAAWLLAVTAEG